MAVVFYLMPFYIYVFMPCHKFLLSYSLCVVSSWSFINAILWCNKKKLSLSSSSFILLKYILANWCLIASPANFNWKMNKNYSLGTLLCVLMKCHEADVETHVETDVCESTYMRKHAVQWENADVMNRIEYDVTMKMYWWVIKGTWNDMDRKIDVQPVK